METGNGNSSSFHKTHFILLCSYPSRIESFSYWFTSDEPAPILLSRNCFQPLSLFLLRPYPPSSPSSSFTLLLNPYPRYLSCSIQGDPGSKQQRSQLKCIGSFVHLLFSSNRARSFKITPLETVECSSNRMFLVSGTLETRLNS